jgi:hypothetical protein
LFCCIPRNVQRIGSVREFKNSFDRERALSGSRAVKQLYRTLESKLLFPVFARLRSPKFFSDLAVKLVFVKPVDARAQLAVRRKPLAGAGDAGAMGIQSISA